MTDIPGIRRTTRALVALTALFALVLAVPEAGAFGIREQNEPNEEPAVENTEDAEQADTPESPGHTDDDPADPENDSNDEQSEPDEPDDGTDDKADRNGEDIDTEGHESAGAIAVEEIFLDIHRAPIELPESMTARDLAVQIEADRRLLAELRKEIPYDRAEAELYLRRIRQLAAISDPVGLVPVANNVIRQAPALFEWLETEYDDPDERARDYYIGGSWAFHRRFEAFRKAVLLTVIRRLDAIGYILQGDQE